MSATQHLIDALVAEKRLAPLELLELPEFADFDASPFAFLGTRRFCGSMMTVGVVRADGLGLELARELHTKFYGISSMLESYAADLEGTKLGAMGILMFVFENGCPDDLVRPLRGLRQGSLTKDACVTYVVDARERRVFLNQGLPMCFAGRRFVRRVLQRAIA